MGGRAWRVLGLSEEEGESLSGKARVVGESRKS